METQLGKPAIIDTQANTGLFRHLTIELSKSLSRLLHMQYHGLPNTMGLKSMNCRHTFDPLIDSSLPNRLTTPPFKLDLG